MTTIVNSTIPLIILIPLVEAGDDLLSLSVLFCLIGVDDIRARGGRYLAMNGISGSEINTAPENPQPSKFAVLEATPILHEASHREFFLQNKLAISQIRTVAIAFAGITIQSSGMMLTESNQIAEFERLFPQAICKS